MTEMEMFLAFYKEIGVKMNPPMRANNGNLLYKIGVCPDYADEITNDQRFDGYHGFYSVIEFTSVGNFVRQGFLE